MNLTVTMCHSHLMSMLLQPEQFQTAVRSYSATSPDVAHEGMAGYMETKVIFEINDLTTFAKLFEFSRTYPSNRSEWYWKVKQGLMGCNK